MDEENIVNSKLCNICKDIDSIVLHLKDNEKFIQAHLNDFIVNDYGTLLPSRENEIVFIDRCEEIGSIGCCIDSRYGRCHPYCLQNDSKDKDGDHGEIKNCNNKNRNSFLSFKKDHEIRFMSMSIMKMCKNISIQNIVDIGSGKGYLGQYLSETSDFDIVGIEGSFEYSLAAKNRQKQIEKCCSETSENSRFRTINFEINTELLHNDSVSQDFIKIIRDNLKSNIGGGAALVGLHACGDLTSNALKLFVKESYFKALQVVGCCYNLCSENVHDGNSGFPISQYLQTKGVFLGQNARMKACQSPEKWKSINQVLNKSLLYRAILQKMIIDKEMGNDCLKDVKFRTIGKKCKSFEDYICGVCRNMDIENADILMCNADSYYEMYAGIWTDMQHFHWLRMQLAPSIEKLILLDRLCYLLESGFHKATIVKIFSTELSPRCYGLLCDKGFT